jgi:hypothetical protein
LPKRVCCARFRCSDQAALDAVRQWEFTPTLLNGVPVPIIMTVTVQFSLAQEPLAQNEALAA